MRKKSIDWGFIKRDSKPGDHTDLIIQGELPRVYYGDTKPVQFISGLPSINLSADFLESIVRERKRKGFGLGQYLVEIETAMQFVPAPMEFAQPVRQYAIESMRYLEERLKTEIPRIKWSIPQGGAQILKSDRAGFIIDYMAPTIIYRIHEGTSTKGNSFALADPSLEFGGKGYIHRRQGMTREYWVAISADSSALVTPFAEVLPIRAYEKIYSVYSAKKELTLQIAEAFSESVAHFLMKEMGEKLKVPNLEEHAHQLLRPFQGSNPAYALVIPAIQWMEHQQTLGKDPVKESYRLVMSDPAAYLLAISQFERQK